MHRIVRAALAVGLLWVGQAQAVRPTESFAEYVGDQIRFSIQLDGQPDFFTNFPPVVATMDSFGIWIDAENPFAMENAHRAIVGDRPMSPMLVVIGGRKLEQFSIASLKLWGGSAPGGWGDQVATAPYTVSPSSLLTFSFDASLLDDPDRRFYYTVFWSNLRHEHYLAEMVSGSTVPVPEPGTWLLFLLGLSVLVASHRRFECTDGRQVLR